MLVRSFFLYVFAIDAYSSQSANGYVSNKKRIQLVFFHQSFDFRGLAATRVAGV